MKGPMKTEVCSRLEVILLIMLPLELLFLMPAGMFLMGGWSYWLMLGFTFWLTWALLGAPPAERAPEPDLHMMAPDSLSSA